SREPAVERSQRVLRHRDIAGAARYADAHAAHEAVDARLRHIDVEERVALERPEVRELVERGVRAAHEERAIEPRGRTQLVLGERAQLLAKEAQPARLAELRVGADVIELVVVAVIAEPGCER